MAEITITLTPISGVWDISSSILPRMVWVDWAWAEKNERIAMTKGARLSNFKVRFVFIDGCFGFFGLRHRVTAGNALQPLHSFPRPHVAARVRVIDAGLVGALGHERLDSVVRASDLVGAAVSDTHGAELPSIGRGDGAAGRHSLVK